MVNKTLGILLKPAVEMEQVKHCEMKTRREGVIECPLNDLFHDVVTVITTSQMVVSNIVLAAAII